MASTALPEATSTSENTSTEATSPEQPTTRPGSAPRARDALLDNAKLLLITLVFLGHAVAPTDHGRIGASIYMWIYIFHMPAFALISGYLSKSFDGSRRRVDRLLTTVAAPYLIFWILYALQRVWAGHDVPGGPLEPVFLTWFLAALFVWRITAPLWQRVRWPIAVAIGISLAGGLSETGEILGMSRIVSMLPFFVVGLYLQPHHLDLLRRTWVRVCSAVVVAGTGALTYLLLQPMSNEWVYWRESLADRDLEILPYGLPARAVFLVLAFTLTAAVLSLIPRRRMWLTAYGALTMYVFLLHGLVIRLAKQFGWYDFSDAFFGDRMTWAVNALLAVVGTFALCSRPVRAATRWAVEPRLDRLLLRWRGELESERARP